MLPRTPARRLRRLGPAAALLALALPLAACSDDGSETPDADPTQVLSDAEARLDETSGVRLSLSTDDQPGVADYLTEAQGVVTADPPAFEGEGSGAFSGIPVQGVGIIAVDGTVYANAFGGYDDFELPECVPDPAGLLDPDTGIATLLAEATDPTAGDSERGGADNDEVLTPYTATVPGTAVQNILPCAPGDTFDARFTVDDQGELRSVELTGEFFEGDGELTYTIDVTEYDVQQEITAP
jgi:lipoprotein LprG